ncbi:MAG: lysylphosphatidylglycerol synthase transmembrane domain-containing protein [Candidatus Electryoneaceae bacterium]|nr:lysylphosphatidylglycerol synthase transmembrane domain-containing protein [Candidatus Electryoneaceae bacterium]
MRRYFLYLKIVAAVALLGVMFYTIRLDAILAALKSARYELLVIGIMLMPVNLGIQAYKWRYLVRLVRPEATTLETVGSLLGGFTFGIVTPGRIGEYSRVLFIHDTPPLKLMGLTIMDKFYNLGCIIAFGLPALLTLPAVSGFFHGHFFIPMLILLVLVDLTLLYFALDPRPVRSLLHALQLTFPRRDKIAQLAGGLDRFGAPQARKTLLLTLLYYCVFLTQYFVLLNGFTSLKLAESIRIGASVLFTKSALPITIGGLGMDQLVSVQFSGQFYVPPEAAFNASMLLFAINVLTPALFGLFFVIRLQAWKRKKKIKTGRGKAF